MDKTDILERTISAHTLASDSNYYRYIFKKTEKIVCAVFYILRTQGSHIRQDDTIIKDVESTAQRTIAEALASLRVLTEHSAASVEKMSYALIELESKLRILNAAHMLGTDLLGVFVNEIDAVLRTLRNYTRRGPENPLFFEEIPPSVKRSRERRPGPPRAGEARKGEPGLPTRKERVMAVLKDKGQATIKDVADAITDCSEKTLQRELNGLIADGVVYREGERRWSKYSLL